MPFTMQCNNKGCGKHQEPYLDPDTNIVYCSDCNQELSNITSFAKNQMKALKQFKQKQIKSFSVKCSFCQKNDRPIIIQNVICCGACKKELTNISSTFLNMLKENLNKID